MSAWNWRVREFDGGYAAKFCSKKGCGAASECLVSYDYVTGRAGRVSRCDKAFCRPHAEAVVAAHKERAA